MLTQRWLVVLGALGVAGLLLAGPARADEFHNTKTTSLNIGDTVDTTPTAGTTHPVAGYGLYARGTTVNAPGNNTITTGGSSAHGIFLNSGQFGSGPVPVAPSSSTATGAIIHTTGAIAAGLFVETATGGTATATLSGVTITTKGQQADGVRVDTSSFGGTAIVGVTGSSITTDEDQTTGVYASGAGTTVTITDTTISSPTYAAIIGQLGATVSVSGKSHITGQVLVSDGSVGIGDGVVVETGVDQLEALGVAYGGILTVGAASVSTAGAGSPGLRMEGGGTATLTGTQLTTTGDHAAGILLDHTISAGTHSVTVIAGVITTSQQASHGVVFTGSKTGTDQVNFDAASKITTNGPGAHGVSVQGGATQTIDVMANAGPGVLVLPSTVGNISIQGPGSALVQAQDAGSVLTIEGNGLPTGVSFGPDAWGVIAENGGTVTFADFATTQGYSLWARGTTGTGTIAIGGGTLTSNSRVRVDAGGLLDISGTAIAALIASLEGNGGKVNLGDKSLAINGGTTTTYAGVIEGTGYFVRQGTGTTILTGDNTYTGGTIIHPGATLQLGDGGTTGSIVGNVNNIGGTLVFNRSNEYDFGGTIVGTGAVEQNGTGNTVFSAAQTYTGPTTINAGTLTVNSDLQSAVTVNAPGTLAGIGTIHKDVTNSGTVSPGTGGVNQQLTIEGNYVGNPGSKLAIRTQLGDDSSPTSQLVISGAGNSASGDTGIVVTNAGGTGAQTTGKGIPIVVTTGGASSTATAFHLDNRVAAGPFEYLLYQGPGPAAPAGTDATSWFLRSQNDAGDVTHRPEVAMHAVYGAMARQLGLLNLGTFHERNGDQQLADTGGRERGWARVFGQHMDQSHSGDVRPSFEGNFVGLQGGFDLWQFASLPGHRDNVGLLAAFTEGRAHVSGHVLAIPDLLVGRVDIDATSIGAYWSHLAPGWYTDVVAMGTIYDGDGRTRFASEVGVDGSGAIVSFEGGFTLGRFMGLKLEPQAQLVYQYISLDADDPFAEVTHRTPDAFHGRIGLRLAADNWPWMLRPYLKANIWQDFAGSDRTIYDGTHEIVNRHRSTTLELGGGVVANIAPNIGLWASADYTTDIGGTEQERESVRGNAGIRIVW
jgi:outer membrane autotransporter protein